MQISKSLAAFCSALLCMICTANAQNLSLSDVLLIDANYPGADSSGTIEGYICQSYENCPGGTIVEPGSPEPAGCTYTQLLGCQFSCQYCDGSRNPATACVRNMLSPGCTVTKLSQACGTRYRGACYDLLSDSGPKCGCEPLIPEQAIGTCIVNGCM